MPQTLTVLADENIANVDDYLAHHNTTLIKLKGRKINQSAIDFYRPDALFIRSVTPIQPNTISDFQNIRFIGSATIGTDHIDTNYLNQHGIIFANANGCSKHSVAQYVVIAISNLRPNSINQPIKLGIIGLGNIGTTLASYAKQLNWQILGYDPFLPPSTLNNCHLDNLLTQSDVISIHTPLTHTGKHATHAMINHHTFAQIQDNALFINTARGEIVCQNALLYAIKQKNLQVVLDVFPHEPSIDQTLLDSLILATPHIAGYTLEGKLNGTDMIYQAFCQVFDLPIKQVIGSLLPNNPYTWAKFIQRIKIDHQATLDDFYNIKQDDKTLRLASNHGVSPTDFDQLRKTYRLRREWIFD